MPRARSIGIAVAAAASVATIAPHALASPGDDPIGGHAVFTGAVSPDPTSIVGNPTALDLGREGVHLWFGGIATLDQYAITLSHEDASGGFSAGTPASSIVSSWGGQFAVYTVKPAFAAGFLFDLPPPSIPPTGIDALRYHTLGGRLHQKTYGALAGSLRLFDGFYVGGSAAYVQTLIDLKFARDTALEAGRAGVASSCGGATCGLENPEADEIYNVHAFKSPQGFNRIAFTLGVTWQVSGAIAIGGMFREPPGLNGAITDQGTVEVTRSARDGGGSTGGIATVAYVPARSFELGARIHTLPSLDTIAGLRWELTSRTTQLDLRMFGTSLMGIPEWYPRPRGFRDTVSAWAGVEQVDEGQRFVGGARVGIDSGAVTSERLSPMQVEGWSLTGDLGAQLRLGRLDRFEFLLVGNYGAQWYVPQDVAHSAYDPIARLDCVDSNYDLSTAACQAVRDGYGIDTAAGHYSRIEHVFRLGLQIDLD